MGKIWWETFNDAFWLTIAGAFFGFLGMSVQSIVKSRCQSCSFCFGMFSCTRSEAVDMDEIDHGVNNTPVANNV